MLPERVCYKLSSDITRHLLKNPELITQNLLDKLRTAINQIESSMKKTGKKAMENITIVFRKILKDLKLSETYSRGMEGSIFMLRNFAMFIDSRLALQTIKIGDMIQVPGFTYRRKLIAQSDGRFRLEGVRGTFSAHSLTRQMPPSI